MTNGFLNYFGALSDIQYRDRQLLTCTRLKMSLFSFNGKPKAAVFSGLPERVGSKHSRLRLAVKRAIVSRMKYNMQRRVNRTRRTMKCTGDHHDAFANGASWRKSFREPRITQITRMKKSRGSRHPRPSVLSVVKKLCPAPGATLIFRAVLRLVRSITVQARTINFVRSLVCFSIQKYAQV